MEPMQLLDFLHRLEKLKSNTRHSWTADGTHETVAAHSWRLTVFAYLLRHEFPQLDMERVVHMCLFHDIGEAVTGDIPSFLKTEHNETTEERAVSELLETLPMPLSGELKALFAEMAAQKTPEARLYKTLDKMEAVLQHNESPLEYWLPLEYELNQTYAAEEAAQFPFLKELRALLLRDTQEKIQGVS